MQIRAATVLAVEMVLEDIKLNGQGKIPITCSYEVDWLLWQMGEKSLDQLKPHHKVKSIFY